MKWLFFEACDVWMFRDSKPFAAQQSFVARSTFPPTPQTMQGVIRSYILELSGESFSEYGHDHYSGPLRQRIGHGVEIGALRLNGPFAARRGDNGAIERLVRMPFDVACVERLVRMPFDVACVERQDDKPPRRYEALSPAAALHFQTAAPFEGWRPLEKPDHLKPLKDETLWLTETGLSEYLDGKPIQNVDAKTESHVVQSIYDIEERVGIGLNYTTRTVGESLFYHAHFIRPRSNIGLLIGVSDNDLPDSGVINIGGESRSAYYETVQPRFSNKARRGRVKIVLLTPAYFSGGWRPANGDWSPWVGGGRLISFVTGRPQIHSGWNLIAKRPKPLLHYVPAGSVYYFEDAEPTDLPFTETPPGQIDHPAIGFGAFAAGVW